MNKKKINDKHIFADERLYWDRKDKEDLEKIARVLKAVRKSLIAMLAAGIVFFAAAYVITDAFIEKVYTAEASFFIKKYPTNVIYKDSEYIDTVNRRYKKDVLSLCTAFLQQNTFYYAIRDRIYQDMDLQEIKSSFRLENNSDDIDLEYLKGCIAYEADFDSSVIKCTVKAKSPETAKRIMGIVEAVVPAKYFEIYGTGMLTRIGDVMVSNKSVYPNPLMNGVKCGLSAVASVLLFVVIKTAYSDKIYCGIELENRLNVPLIEAISNYGRAEFDNIKCKLDFVLSQNSNNMAVFSGIDYNADITSIMGGIADYIAECGQNALIVDLDMHYPVIHKGFNLSNKKGAADVLAKKCSLYEAIQPFQGFNVLTAGAAYGNVSDALISSECAELLDKLKSMYDYIFIAAPPINMFSDTEWLSGRAGTTVLLIKENASLYKTLNKAMAIAERLNIGGVIAQKV